MNSLTYFQSYQSYFWQWEDNAEVLAIPGGNTIAYWGFVEDVMESLAPQGLPPFGSLLLGILATNPNTEKSIEQVGAILKPNPTIDTSLIKHILDFLTVVVSVPSTYKSGPTRFVLLQTIFHNCHGRLSIKDSKRISKKDDFQPKDFISAITHPQALTPGFLTADLRAFALLNQKFRSVEEILAKMIALPEIREEAISLPEETGVSGKPDDLVDQLIDNPNTFPVGALIRQLWSGLQIPIHSSLPSQQPLGGISDLTNKGDFDKLLISEFANDDLVFLSRLANNEALYLQREIPPSHPQQRRIFLLDTSLKNWGTPKLVAFAVALAIAHHPKTTLASSVCVVGNAYTEVGLESVSQIMEALLQLNGSLHATQGLEDFLANGPIQPQDEIFWITSQEARNHPAMTRALHDYRDRLAYCIFTDASGCLEVYKNQRTGRKHLQTLQLPLNELWKKPKKEIVSVAGPKASNIPILFRTPPAIKKIFHTHTDELLVLTGDKALLKQYYKVEKTHAKGWELLCESLPFSYTTSQIGISSKGDYVLLLFNANTRQGVLFNLTTHKDISFGFPEWRSTSFASFVYDHTQQVFYHKNINGVWRIDLNGKPEKLPSAVMSADNFVLLWKSHAERADEAKKQVYDSHSVLKNIPHLYVNEVNNLVFGKHELHLRQEQHITLNFTNFQKRVLEANRVSSGLFTFPEGSRIEVMAAGMLLLQSSNPRLPVVYIPSVLDASLGVATPHEFAGNEYYYKDAYCMVKLVSAGELKVKVIKIIMDFAGKGLAECKELVDTAPNIIAEKMPEAKAYQLKKDLESGGAQVEIRTLQPESSLKKIHTATFFREYIEAFVKHIQTHGANP